jgi:dinuclear metal center YbgI/SA1388 family protein
VTDRAGVEPARVVEALDAIAPPRLAAEWDNVGLLLEGTRAVKRALICVDLTERVLAEALQIDADLIVAYHPPIFQPVGRLTRRSPLGRVLLDAVRAGLTVYSPHTALDAAADGMTDWLLGACGEVDQVVPIEPRPDEPAVGAGRVGVLRQPAPVHQVVARIKARLDLPLVRVAQPEGRGRVSTVAACPGAGGSVLNRARADLLLTGEMRHHDVLARVAAGQVVVLTDHTHTERGYLPTLARRLSGKLPALEVRCSAVDADPLVPR